MDLTFPGVHRILPARWSTRESGSSHDALDAYPKFGTKSRYLCFKIYFILKGYDTYLKYNSRYAAVSLLNNRMDMLISYHQILWIIGENLRQVLATSVDKQKMQEWDALCDHSLA